MSSAARTGDTTTPPIEKKSEPPVSAPRLGDEPLSLRALAAWARPGVELALTPTAVERIERSAKALARIHARGDEIYGVTTSVGGSVGTNVPVEHSADLSLNVLRMHGCGMGRMLAEDEAAAVLIVRLSSLSKGLSGLRLEVVERLVELLRVGVLPAIPSEGSVGASGDLTPLSYVAALLVGEREALVEGELVEAKAALASAGLEPLRLEPKEALALMNGTSVATALASLAWVRADRLARLAATLTAAASHATRGNPEHFDVRIHEAKPHAGQTRAAGWIREDLDGGNPAGPPQHLQDRYSIRCAPHVIGTLADTLDWSGAMLETELNGVSDNPIVDAEREEVLHGGNFYGGHVAQACDTLKVAVANLACLVDRQIMLLCHPDENGGLPRDLVGVKGPEACAHNGFKAASIAASSMAAEALKQSGPASIFSRSTELHNQDKVPMATTAARDLVRVVELTEQVLAIGVLASCQALELRGEAEPPAVEAFRSRVRDLAPPLDEDRRMDLDQGAVLAQIRADGLSAAPRERRWKSTH